MRNNTQYNLVFNSCEAIIFKGTFRKYTGMRDSGWECIGEETYNQNGVMNGYWFCVQSKPIKISKELYETLKTEVLKIEKQKSILIASMAAIAENDAKKLKVKK